VADLVPRAPGRVGACGGSCAVDQGAPVAGSRPRPWRRMKLMRGHGSRSREAAMRNRLFRTAVGRRQSQEEKLCQERTWEGIRFKWSHVGHVEVCPPRDAKTSTRNPEDARERSSGGCPAFSFGKTSSTRAAQTAKAKAYKNLIHTSDLSPPFPGSDGRPTPQSTSHPHPILGLSARLRYYTPRVRALLAPGSQVTTSLARSLSTARPSRARARSRARPQ
jgi:hypothetical protein